MVTCAVDSLRSHRCLPYRGRILEPCVINHRGPAIGPKRPGLEPVRSASAWKMRHDLANVTPDVYLAAVT
jgi:hypothetical protein